jgi:hypothetical protein
MDGWSTYTHRALDLLAILPGEFQRTASKQLTRLELDVGTSNGAVM